LIASGDGYDLALQAIRHFTSGSVTRLWKGRFSESKSPRSNFPGGPERFDDPRRPNDQLFFNKRCFQARRLLTRR